MNSKYLLMAINKQNESDDACQYLLEQYNKNKACFTRLIFIFCRLPVSTYNWLHKQTRESFADFKFMSMYSDSFR